MPVSGSCPALSPPSSSQSAEKRGQEREHEFCLLLSNDPRVEREEG